MYKYYVAFQATNSANTSNWTVASRIVEISQKLNSTDAIVEILGVLSKEVKMPFVIILNQIELKNK